MTCLMGALGITQFWFVFTGLFFRPWLNRSAAGGQMSIGGLCPNADPISSERAFIHLEMLLGFRAEPPRVGSW